MPFITVLALKGRTLDQRRLFADEITRLAVKCLDAEPEEVRVRFVEMDATEFARGGRLFADQS
ncbi:4-oxalocrotonate tautomerase family protein [Streptomyces sp. NPDC002476]|uniref:tautomerase family protein n=1 Tax=Streptomyces sp. NPDC002476 TaxID=3364648 RepID=UPI0036998BCA